MTTFKAGTIVMFTEGQWSDYSVRGIYKVLQDCPADSLFSKWKEECQKVDKFYSLEFPLFIESLVGTYLELVPTEEYHVD